jgi:hypothetical protein
MELNILSLTYLFLRLAPFILVSFFSLASVFNQDFKGFIYLIGLIFACFSTVLLGNMIPIPFMPVPNEICNMVTFGQSNSFSKLPLSQCIFGYTAAYLFYVIFKYQYVLQNIPTLLFFPMIIMFDMAWNLKNSCYNIIQLAMSVGFGIGFGYLWAYVIDRTKMTQLQYFNQISGKPECSRPAKNTFRCRVYKNGQLLNT